MSVRSIGLTLLLAFALAGTSAAAAQQTHWFIIGDSWGALIGPTQEAKLQELGLNYPFTNLAVGGTTAEQWAEDQFGLLSGATSALSALPAQDSAIVYVSLGGNDFLGEFADQGAAIFLRIRDDLAIIVAELLAAKPETTILLGGYDILNFEKSLLCELIALGIVGTSEPEGMNRLVGVGQRLLLDVAPEESRVLPVPVIGALQGSPRQPDLSSWSPAELITPDCIHLTPEGYDIFNDAMFDLLGATVAD